MTEINADEIFNILSNKKTKYHYSAIALNEASTYLAIDLENQFALMIPTEKNASLNQNLATDLISLQFFVECSVKNQNGEIINENFHIIKCKSNEQSIIKTFIILCIAFSNKLYNGSEYEEDIVNFFTSLIKLFKVTPSKDLRKERQGLWGELFTIRNTGRISDFVRYWHNDSTRKFDFSNNEYKLEIKTTSKLERIHEFSHQQLLGSREKVINVVSLLLRYEDSGISLRQLIEEIRREINNDINLLMKLEYFVKQAGMDNELEEGPVFDENDAKINMRWYKSDVIPKFSEPEPSGVTNARYKVDLSTTAYMTSEEIEELLQNGYSNYGMLNRIDL